MAIKLADTQAVLLHSPDQNHVILLSRVSSEGEIKAAFVLIDATMVEFYDDVCREVARVHEKFGTWTDLHQSFPTGLVHPQHYIAACDTARIDRLMEEFSHEAFEKGKSPSMPVCRLRDKLSWSAFLEVLVDAGYIPHLFMEPPGIELAPPVLEVDCSAGWHYSACLNVTEKYSECPDDKIWNFDIAIEQARKLLGLPDCEILTRPEDLVGSIARMQADGDYWTSDGELVTPEEGQRRKVKPYDMESDDAVDTLNRLIQHARDLRDSRKTWIPATNQNTK